ncbi:MAG: hypothetical protein HYT38_00195, partial [Candidatus Sungbacteria bacterium]|nr:hypothetical protein [Candidatus Sungbacteria bacterium]
MIKKLFLILIFVSVFTVLILAGKLAWAASSKGLVTLSDTVSSSGTGPNGTITINASVNNAYTGYYWYKIIGAQVDSDTKWSNYSFGYGTGMSGSFSFTGLGGGSHQATSKATLYLWNGSKYVFWADLSNGPTTLDIPNPAPQISVDLKVDPDSTGGPALPGDGPYSVVEGTWVRVHWSYQNATNCTASNWTGLSNDTSGSTGEQVNGSVIYGISCRNNDTGQTASDSVTVDTTPAPPLPTASITASPSVNGTYSDGPISVAYNNPAYLSWTSTNATSCAITPDITGTEGTSDSGRTTGNLTANTTYSITCAGAGGTSPADTVVVNVAAPVPTLSVNLSVSIPPPAGTDVVASATVDGTAAGPINYNFWWNCNSSATTVGGVNTGAGAGCAALATPASGTCVSNNYGYKCNGVTTNPQTATHTYAAGTYTSKVIVERGAATPAEARSGITIVPPAFDYTLSADDVSVVRGSSVTNTITVTKTAGTAESVTLAESDTSAQITPSFSP